jgi:hypothetical protein
MVSERVYKTIWGMFAGRCAICREELVETGSSGAKLLVGEVAHIVGGKQKAARGQLQLSAARRNDADNLILLCRKHHKIVDDDRENYTVEKLHQIRGEYLGWLKGQLQRPEPWKMKLSQLCYINVPRLCELAELQGHTVDLSQYRGNQTLHSLGWELNYVMAQFKRLLSAVSLNAMPFHSLVGAHDAYIGSVISFDQLRFRTKNAHFDNPNKEQHVTFTGDLSKDPHIYVKGSAFKLVLNINPTWITTTTAYCLFRPSGGQSTFSGLARINNVDYETATLFGTSWVIGLGPGLFEYLEERDLLFPIKTDRIEDRLADLANAETGKMRQVYFTPPPERCDLCKRNIQFEKYMIDGAIPPAGAWGCVCAGCFSRKAMEIGIGKGQLYEKEGSGWRLVAGGFSTGDDD